MDTINTQAEKDLPELNIKSCKYEDRGSLGTSGNFRGLRQGWKKKWGSEKGKE